MHIIFLVFIALMFDFINALHDPANSIATIISARVLAPGCAVLRELFFTFIAFLFFGMPVSTTHTITGAIMGA